MLKWFSQIAAITEVRPAQPSATAGGGAGHGDWHRRRGDGVGGRAVHRGRLSRAMNASSAPDAAIVLRSGAKPARWTAGLTGRRRRSSPTCPGLARNAQGVMASPELFVIIDRPNAPRARTRTCRCGGLKAPPLPYMTGSRCRGRLLEWGKEEVIVGSGRGGAGIRRPGGGVHLESGALPVARGGRVHRQRRRERIGNLDGCQGAPGGLQTGRFLPIHPRAATAPPAAFQRVQGRADLQPAGHGEGRTAIGVLCRSIPNDDQPDQHPRCAHRGADGGRRGVWRAEHHVQRRGGADAEIATLRALGFGGGAVVVAFLLESLALALVGGDLGAAAAYAAFNNFHTSTMNFPEFQPGRLRVSGDAGTAGARRDLVADHRPGGRAVPGPPGRAPAHCGGLAGVVGDGGAPEFEAADETAI